MRVDRLHDVANISSRLLDVDDTGVIETGFLNGRDELVVERHQNPVVLRGTREVFSIGIAPPRARTREGRTRRVPSDTAFVGYVETIDSLTARFELRGYLCDGCQR